MESTNPQSSTTAGHAPSSHPTPPQAKSPTATNAPVTTPKPDQPSPQGQPEPQEKSFDVVGEIADFLSDIKERIRKFPAEHRDALQRDLIRDLQNPILNVGANPLRRTPVVEVPHESGMGVRVVPADEAAKGRFDRTEEIPQNTAAARVLTETSPKQ